jgi:hypothetical protein
VTMAMGAAVLVAALACSMVTGGVDSGNERRVDATVSSQTGHPVPTSAAPSPTPTVIGPLPSGFEQTGIVQATVEGQPFTWYTFRSPGIGEAMMNSAVWGLQAGTLGTYKGVVALAGAFEGDTPAPKSAIYVEFPFRDEGAPFEREVPANPLEPAVNVILHLESGDYKMINGRLTLTDVSVQGDKRRISGTLEGTLAASDLQGTLDESNTIELTDGRLQLSQVDGNQTGE